MQPVYIFDAIFTPRGAGNAKGSLSQTRPIELVSQLVHSIQERTDVDAALIDDLVLGCVTQTKDQGSNIARSAALYADLPNNVAGMTINRFCTSGLDAIRAAAHSITAEGGMRLAGGVESLSRVPMFSDKGAWFADPDVAAKTRFIHMGIAADLLASLDGRTREELDDYALRSHQLASQWQSPSMVSIKNADGEVVLDKDECVREGLSKEKLSALPPAFAEFGAAGANALALKHYPELDEIQHLHTAGSSPGQTDAASLLLLGDETSAEQTGLKPKGRIIATAVAGGEPVVMLTAAVEASRKALKLAGLDVEQIDLFEFNESFAGTALHFRDELGIPMEKFNISGGAIARGHPLGATGGILVATLLDLLDEKQQRYGLTSIVGGAGVATAIIVERL